VLRSLQRGAELGQTLAPDCSPEFGEYGCLFLDDMKLDTLDQQHHLRPEPLMRRREPVELCEHRLRRVMLLQRFEHILLVIGERLSHRRVEKLFFDRGVARQFLDDLLCQLLASARRVRSRPLEASKQRPDRLVILFE
jgi:hypothetical protein